VQRDATLYAVGIMRTICAANLFSLAHCDGACALLLNLLDECLRRLVRRDNTPPASVDHPPAPPSSLCGAADLQLGSFHI
jgi:hypothetical protein